MNDKNGIVYLVGAGPGDPGLITLKGKECIERADVVVYDYLAATELLGHAREDAELIYVGKKGGDHTLSQDGINALLVEKACKGLVVTRLKGGDPFIFGRGGEEVEVIIEAGIAFEVVPGVTSAVAAPAYAGIPLTHRKFTSTVAFVTGHEDPQKESSNIDWQALATGIGTLVFFMGVKNLENITRQLMKHGMAPDKPAALIGWGTTPRQMTVTGTLATINAEAAKAGMKPPALIVIGDVVELRERMKWFENRPLLGKRIVVTRARKQASGFLKMLSDAGAECLECPTIKVAPPQSWDALARHRNRRYRLRHRRLGRHSLCHGLGDRRLVVHGKFDLLRTQGIRQSHLVVHYLEKPLARCLQYGIVAGIPKPLPDRVEIIPKLWSFPGRFDK